MNPFGEIQNLETYEKKQQGPQSKNKSVSCPVCNNEMTYIQSCHVKCMACGAELSCEDKGWFWG